MRLALQSTSFDNVPTLARSQDVQPLNITPFG